MHCNSSMTLLINYHTHDKPIWTTNSRCPQLSLDDATVLVRVVGARCLQVKKELRPTIDWEMLHIKAMCSLALANFQCPCELCGKSMAHDATTLTCPVCMIPSHKTCVDNVVANMSQAPTQLGELTPQVVIAKLADININVDGICKLCQLHIGKHGT